MNKPKGVYSTNVAQGEQVDAVVGGRDDERRARPRCGGKRALELRGIDTVGDSEVGVVLRRDERRPPKRRPHA